MKELRLSFFEETKRVYRWICKVNENDEDGKRWGGEERVIHFYWKLFYIFSFFSTFILMAFNPKRWVLLNEKLLGVDWLIEMYANKIIVVSWNHWIDKLRMMMVKWCDERAESQV